MAAKASAAKPLVPAGLNPVWGDDSPQAIAEANTPAAHSVTSLLLSGQQLAAHLGRHPTYISAMKAIGFEFDYGNRCTLAHALNWLKDHPNFRTTGYRLDSPEFVKSKRRRPRRRPAIAGK
jgi:hypothetical protein